MIVKKASVKSPLGHDINFFERAEPAAAGNIFILGGFHGDEPEGVYIVEKLAEELSAQPDLRLGHNLYLLPCLNPDGRALKTRENAHKIDLNRNYPTQNFTTDCVNPHNGKSSAGQSPASEPETRFMIELAETYRPLRILSIHSDLHVVDYDGPARELALRMSKLCGYKLVENIGYPTNGSFGTWAGIERNIPVITLETRKADSPADFEKIWQELRLAVLDFCQT